MYDIVSLGEPLTGLADSAVSHAELRLTGQSFDRGMLEHARVLHMDSSSLALEPARSAAYEAVDIAKAAGAVIFYAPHYRASLWNTETDAIRFLRSLIITADIMKVSAEELPLLTGETDLSKAADLLFDQGGRIIFIESDDSIFIRVGKDSRLIDMPRSESAFASKTEDALYKRFLYRFLASGKTLKQVSIGDAMEWLQKF